MLAGIYRGGVFRVGQQISFIVSQDRSVDVRAYTLSGVPTGSLSSWPDTRSVHIVYDAGARRETTLLHFTKTITGTVERNGHSRTVHFTDQGFVVSGLGAGAPYDGTIDELLPFFHLRAYLRQVLDSRSPVVSDVTVAGRPAWRIVTTMATGRGPQGPISQPVTIVIDKRTRLPLRFSWRASGDPLTQLRVTDMQVDAPQPAGAFTIRFPRGTFVLAFKPGSVFYTGPDQHTISFGDAGAMRRLMQSVDIEPAFPSWMPAGFVRSAATYGSSGSMESERDRAYRMTQDTVVLSLAYRRGFDAISVSLQPTGSGHGAETVNGRTYALHGEDPFLQVYGSAYHYIAAHTRNVVLRSGPFAGKVAHIVVEPERDAASVGRGRSLHGDGVGRSLERRHDPRGRVAEGVAVAWRTGPKDESANAFLGMAVSPSASAGLPPSWVQHEAAWRALAARPDRYSDVGDGYPGPPGMGPPSNRVCRQTPEVTGSRGVKLQPE